MSEIELKELDLEDEGLKEVMGKQFIDATVPLSEMPEPVQVNANTTGTAKAAHRPTNDPTKVFQDCTEWEPVKEHNWMDGLKECAKWALIFGGLNMLIFYWQMAGLMAESIAVPSMWVCCALAGYGVGRNVWRWSK